MNHKELSDERIRKDKASRTMLILAMGSIVMVFAALTSAYVVSKSRPDWLVDFQMPSAFSWSTIAIVLSSITFHLAKNAIKKDERAKTTMLLWITLVLGFLFVYFQTVGFGQFVEQGYFFTGSESNITTSFLYVIVLAHIAHLAGGIISLFVIIYNHYKQKYNSSQSVGIELGLMYWHFLDVLWIYLFLFFTFYK